MYRYLIVIGLLISATAAKADWLLDSKESQLNFVTTKSGQVAEVHRFSALEGLLDAAGAFKLSIQLASIDSLIPIRDERMRELLFETARFPTATVTANIDPARLAALPIGMSQVHVVDGKLDLHGTVKTIQVDVLVARLAADQLLVVSRTPVIVNAAEVGLVEGVEKLRAIAGLPAISPAVPVNFVLGFSQAPSANPEP